MTSSFDQEREQQQEQEREMRKALHPYLGMWVKVHGVFRAFGRQPDASRVTALCDVQLIDDDGTRVELGHCWIQHARAIQRRNPEKGDGFTAECKVDRYRKKLNGTDGEGGCHVQDYNLTYPRHVVFDHDGQEKPHSVKDTLVVQGINSSPEVSDPGGADAARGENAIRYRDARPDQKEGKVEVCPIEPTGIEIVKVKAALKASGIAIEEALLYIPPLIKLTSEAGSPQKLEKILTRLQEILA